VFADGGVDGGAQGTAVLFSARWRCSWYCWRWRCAIYRFLRRKLPRHNRLLARDGEESGDLAFCGRVLLVSGSGNGGGRMDRLLCFAAGSARGGDGVDDAGVLLVGFDVGRALGTAFLRHASERRVLRAGCAAGAAGIGLMLWAPSLAGRDWRSADYGAKFCDAVSITVARLSQRFGVAARSNWRDHVFAGSGGTGRFFVDGGCDLARHWESARRAAAPSGGDCNFCSSSSVRFSMREFCPKDF